MNDSPRRAQGPRRAPTDPSHPRPGPARGRARLILFVNGVRYTIRPVPCRSTAAVRAFSLLHPDGTAHRVTQLSHGAACSCAEFARRGAACGHLRALAVFGVVSTATDVPRKAHVPRGPLALARPSAPIDDGDVRSLTGSVG